MDEGYLCQGPRDSSCILLTVVKLNPADITYIDACQRQLHLRLRQVTGSLLPWPRVQH